jgi:DNA-directed RNA polymerase subunit K/omega
MTDLFLEDKVLNYSQDRYQLILLTLRWARAMKAKGSAEPMQALIETALRDIVEGKITKEEILANKLPPPVPVEEIPSIVSVAEEGSLDLKALADDDDEDKKKAKKKKKKED